MTKAAHIAQSYIHHLQRGDTDKILGLFAETGRVSSPLYGELPAEQFYMLLANDTQQSELYIKEIFENAEAHSIALYFNFRWTLQSGKQVDFDVVDIIKYDDQHKITSLTIIYDTVITRQYFDELNLSK